MAADGEIGLNFAAKLTCHCEPHAESARPRCPETHRAAPAPTLTHCLLGEKLTAMENEANSFISDDDSLESFHHKLYAKRKELETVIQAICGFGVYGLTNQPSGTPALIC